MEKTIMDKQVTYDFARDLENTHEVSTTLCCKLEKS